MKIGLVNKNKIVPAEQLMSSCKELAQKIGQKGPLAVRVTKKIINAASLAKMGDLYLCEPELVEKLMLSGGGEGRHTGFH